jgi:hypothetical protein
VDAVLRGDVPTRLTQEFVGEVKRRRDRRHRRHLAAATTHVRVLVKDAVLGGDATHLGRDATGTPVQAEVLRDAATTELVATAAVAAPTASDVIAALERARDERGVHPLVFQSDGGPENIAAEVADYLRAHRIIHLRNLPHTPQHNAGTERSHRELKAALDLDPTRPLPPATDPSWGPRLDTACRTLNHHLPRQSRHWMTATAYAATLACWYHLTLRDRFYQATCSAIQEALRGLEDPRARRKAEREAILSTMERFGLIKRTRGDAPLRYPKPERVL